jgi:hypothetical protein
MPVTTGHAYRESREALRVTDKRQLRFTAAQREGDCLPIGELGSKAIYQVCAGQFVATTLTK